MKLTTHPCLTQWLRMCVSLLTEFTAGFLDIFLKENSVRQQIYVHSWEVCFNLRCGCYWRSCWRERIRFFLDMVSSHRHYEGSQALHTLGCSDPGTSSSRTSGPLNVQELRSAETSVASHRVTSVPIHEHSRAAQLWKCQRSHFNRAGTVLTT